jgi:hypothetical protein
MRRSADHTISCRSRPQASAGRAPGKAALSSGGSKHIVRPAATRVAKFRNVHSHRESRPAPGLRRFCQARRNVSCANSSLFSILPVALYATA